MEYASVKAAGSGSAFSDKDCLLMVIPNKGAALAGDDAVGWITGRKEVLSSKCTPSELPGPVLDWSQAHASTVAASESPLERHELDHGLVLDLFRNHTGKCLLLVQESFTRFSQEYGLSPRQTEVMQWVCEGKTNPEIATILGVTTHTVNRHMEQVRRKFKVENRQQVILVMLERYRGRKRARALAAPPREEEREKK